MQSKNSLYFALTVPQSAQRFRRRCRLARTIYFFLATALALWVIFGTEEKIGFLAAWLAGMAVIFTLALILIAALALEQKALYNILFWDCDPVKYQQVLSLLPARRPRVHAAYQLRYAQCCAVLHQFDQMEQLLAGLPPMKSGITKLACLNMGMNHAFTLRDAAGLGALRQSLDILCRENAGKWLFEKNAAPVRMLLDAYQAILAGDDGTARGAVMAFLEASQETLPKVGGSMMLAEMDLRQGERANAAARLAYAAQWGGTTAAGAEARALLAQYFAPAAAPQPPAAGENV